MLVELALAVALGGGDLPDVVLLRPEPAVYGQVALDATVSRLISILAGSGA